MRGLCGPSRLWRLPAMVAPVLLTAAVGVLPAAADTLLTLTPAKATAGQVVKVAGTGFAPQLAALGAAGSTASGGGGSAMTGDVPCVLLLGGTTAGACVLDGSGGLSGSLTVPAGMAYGAQPIQARSAGGVGTATLQVLPAAVPAPPLSVLATVPDVQHLTVRSARARLELAGLRLSGGGARGNRRVADQSPAPGRRIRRGSIVAVALDGGSTKGQHPAPSPTSSTNPVQPDPTADATAVQVIPAASSLRSDRTLELVARVAALLLLLITVGGTAVAVHRRRPPHRADPTREPPAPAHLLARPDNSALVRTRQTAPPGPTLLLAPRVDRSLQVTVDVTPDVTPDVTSDVSPDRTLEKTR